MFKAIDGTPIYRITKPESKDCRRHTGPVRDQPEKLTTRTLRACLCSQGPALCRNCGLCEYGKEYIKRHENSNAKRTARGNSRKVP